MLDIFQTWLPLIIVATTAVYIYLKYYVFNYWQRHGVPCEEPSIPLGNIPLSHFFSKINIGNFLKENYEKFSKHPFHGFYSFHKPVIMINDPELIRTILVKEFHRFPDRGWFSNAKLDPLSRILFMLPGDDWKNLRAKVSPIFTSGKLKEMHNLLVEISDEMIKTCEREKKKSDILDVKDIVARYTTDIISSIVYGFNCDSLKNPEADFRIHGVEAIEFGKLSLIFAIFAPDILEKLNLPVVRKKTSKFFMGTFNNMVNHRLKEKIVRKDFLNLLMQLMDHTTLGEESAEKLNSGDAAAQAFVFFVAGYETASSIITFCLLELAAHPDIQDRLRGEIDKMYDETPGITYDKLTSNEYLDMVVTEAIRMHPAGPFLNRICIEDFKIPDSNFTIPKGMRVVISASGIHRNPEFYPDPENFDPTRQSKENRLARNKFVQLEFGEGPRYCIGKRFGKLKVKQAIAAMLRNYKFHICENTTYPPTYSTNTFVQMPETEVFLRFEKREI